MAEFLREAVGVEGKELREELALNSSELRLSEASLRPLLMELLSSQLQHARKANYEQCFYTEIQLSNRIRHFHSSPRQPIKGGEAKD